MGVPPAGVQPLAQSVLRAEAAGVTPPAQLAEARAAPAPKPAPAQPAPAAKPAPAAAKPAPGPTPLPKTTAAIAPRNAPYVTQSYSGPRPSALPLAAAAPLAEAELLLAPGAIAAGNGGLGSLFGSLGVVLSGGLGGYVFRQQKEQVRGGSCGGAGVYGGGACVSVCLGCQRPGACHTR
jgi:hypothetical protein